MLCTDSTLVAESGDRTLAADLDDFLDDLADFVAGLAFGGSDKLVNSTA